MGLLKNALAQLEVRLQALIEGSAAQIFPTRDAQDELVHQLLLAMQAGVKDEVAPNLYLLTLPASQASALRQDSSLLEALAQTVQELAGESGLTFLSPPIVRVIPDADLKPGEIRVVTQNSIENLAETTDLVVEPALNAPLVPVNAFLIVDGTRIFTLNQSVVNIGRRPDNHLVIDDGRVSRVHAQLRAIKGRYVIFDLDSLGGTFVNDQRIHQSVLYPGDVISLAGLPLVFGQDETRLGETQKLASA
jgi:hypothetical protein